MRKELTISAIVTQDATLSMYRGELDAFLAENIGKRLTIRIQADTIGTSEAMRGYYFGYIVPRIQQALYDIGERKSKKDTDSWLRSLCPACQAEDGVLSVSQMGKPEMMDLLDWVKQFAAENLYLVLEDADSI